MLILKDLDSLKRVDFELIHSFLSPIVLSPIVPRSLDTKLMAQPSSYSTGAVLSVPSLRSRAR